MDSVNSGTENDKGQVLNTSKNPKSLKELTSLPKPKLNVILKENELSTKGKRSQKITVLAKKLQIDLHEDDDEDTFNQALRVAQSSVKGWKFDSKAIPSIQLQDVSSFLIEKNCVNAKHSVNFEEYTKDTLRRYKCLRGYEHYASKHIHSFETNDEFSENYIVIRCLCHPSWDTSGTQYQVYLVFNSKLNKVIGANCSCVAGRGEACTHIAGALFTLEDFTSRGYQTLSASTDILCKWNEPRGTKVQPKPIQDVLIEKRGPMKGKRKRKDPNYNPINPAKRQVNYEAVKKLIHTLNLNSIDVPFLRAVDPEKWRPCWMSYPPAIDGPSSLPEILDEFSVDLIPALEEEVTTNRFIPTSILSLVKSCRFENPKYLFNAIRWSADEIETISEITQGQSSNPNWHHFHKGLITGTIAHDVLVQTRKEECKQNTSKIIHQILQGSLFQGNTATKYGLDNEAVAANSYLNKIAGNHINFTLQEQGLLLSGQYPFLGASVDRIRHCECCSPCLVEIKCPYRLRDKDVTDLSTLEFITGNTSNSTWRLNTNHKYYTQVQLYMAVTNITTTDFVIWSPNQTEIITVLFDMNFWKNAIEKIGHFYEFFVSPALLSLNHHAANQQREEFANDTLQTCEGKRSLCSVCKMYLPDNVYDNKEASVCCDCSCQCEKWFHWKCCDYEPTSVADWLCNECKNH
ncbi:uncharacterized protein LOC126811178 [Patella vulgata]|uniref:uncharacterized protein LOC126811178 n=1 Tax=Patella vulgata TaxID=6465 RepID=UPI0024A8F7A9|nr:uncharacterized protein LOC126811178 [Patella vulgata]